jgi:hypothetical protein
MRHPLFWGIVIGAVGVYALHWVMPGTRAVGQPG